MSGDFDTEVGQEKALRLEVASDTGNQHSHGGIVASESSSSSGTGMASFPQGLLTTKFKVKYGLEDFHRIFL